ACRVRLSPAGRVISSPEPAASRQRKTARSLNGSAADMAIAATIFCLASLLGAYAVVGYRAAGGEQYFYQSEFGPAVMVACGRGFLNPDTDTIPPLAAFLSQQTDAFDCASLPASISASDPDPYQRVSRYLELTVALIWKVTGVSWSRLVVLPGILFGCVAALYYGLFRLGLSRVFA